MTGDYISREALGDVLADFWIQKFSPCIDFLNSVCDIKSADVRPVVLCKECKYRNTDKYGSWCLNDYEHNLKDDDFCSRGKRK